VTLRIKFEGGARRLALALTGIAAVIFLCVVVVGHYIKAVMADPRLNFGRDALMNAAERYPGSARLHAAAASSELLEADRDLTRAEKHARGAIRLSPYKSSYRVLLASIVEARGDRPEAEREMREAVRLAPADTELRWRLANVLLRERRLDESIKEFQVATTRSERLLPATYDLVWRASRGSVKALQSIAGERPAARLRLARFLLDQSQVAAAVEVFSGVDRTARVGAAEAAGFLDKLVAAGRLEEAHAVWINLMAGGTTLKATELIWNGGFESDVVKGFTQFDWMLGASPYARIYVDASVSHSGDRSLRIDFSGRDTTTLEHEVKQLAVLQRDARYRLEVYVRTERLETPEGPRVVVTDASNNWLAASDPIVAGSDEWQRLSVDFRLPKTADGGVLVTVKRRPKYSYDDPTEGTIWLDDFSLTKRDR
jgi:carbohydrate binding protein with CBM4/9 domain